jgi:hypothetical protein
MEPFVQKMTRLAFSVECRGIELLSVLNRMPPGFDDQEQHIIELWKRDAKAIALDLVRDASIAIDAKDLAAHYMTTHRVEENNPSNNSETNTHMTEAAPCDY